MDMYFCVGSLLSDVSFSFYKKKDGEEILKCEFTVNILSYTDAYGKEHFEKARFIAWDKKAQEIQKEFEKGYFRSGALVSATGSKRSGSYRSEDGREVLGCYFNLTAIRDLSTQAPLNIASAVEFPEGFYKEAIDMQNNLERNRDFPPREDIQEDDPGEGSKERPLKETMPADVSLSDPGFKRRKKL